MLVQENSYTQHSFEDSSRPRPLAQRALLLARALRHTSSLLDSRQLTRALWLFSLACSSSAKGSPGHRSARLSRFPCLHS